MVVTIKKQQYYLWRAVDSDGNVLEVLLQRHRDIEAAERFFRKLLKKQGFVPRVMVTDKIRGHFHPKQPELSAKRYREQLQQRFEAW